MHYWVFSLIHVTSQAQSGIEGGYKMNSLQISDGLTTAYICETIMGGGAGLGSITLYCNVLLLLSFISSNNNITS